MQVSVAAAAAEERPIIEALMEPYLAELGGRGPYPRLASYWQTAERFPYLLRHEGEVVGFALVEKQPGEALYELVEFYIVATVRNRGLGRHAALSLFALHAGSWSVGVRSDNALGRVFWQRVLQGIPSLTRVPVKAPEGIVYGFSNHSEA